jgi:probable H4MPT-linked C1 transfer pathway protein
VKSAVDVFGEKIKIFGRRGEFFTPAVAIKKWEETASANWSAVPLLLSRNADSVLHIDIGSTTTDLTPLREGKIANREWDDFGRMKNGELVYAGYLRTPVGSVIGSFNIDGEEVPVVPEYFAVMGDVYLALGMISKREYAVDTPDGAPKTKSASLARLARTVLSERKTLGDETLFDMARQTATAQREKIVAAVLKHRLDTVVTGRGSFILDEAVKSGEIKTARLDFVGTPVSNLDPSTALALLRRRILC